MSEGRWTHTAYCDAAQAEIAAFTTLAREVDAHAPVPSCPGWTVADLVRHLGRIHRWAGALVARRSPCDLRSRELELDFPEDRYDRSAYLSWLAESARQLLVALRTADPQDAMWGWAADQRVGFWSCRMLHETAVHRGDLTLAAGQRPELDAAVAADGIDELLDNLPSAAAFTPNVAHLRGAGETIALDTEAEGWLITLERDGYTWRRTRGSPSRPRRSPARPRTCTCCCGDGSSWTTPRWPCPETRPC